MIFFLPFRFHLSLVTSYTFQIILYILNRFIMHKAIVLERQISPKTVTILLLHYCFPQNHLCPIYSRWALQAWSCFFSSYTQSCLVFPTAESQSLNWCLDINVYYLSVRTNITHTIPLHLHPLNSGLAHLPREHALVSRICLDKQDICCGDKNACVLCVPVQEYTRRISSL